ncbi:MAG: hypothetical protein IPH88_09865 [Bacteroidales bacterium]|nr:hypothetical protein [Bacteroidales bacterium]
MKTNLRTLKWMFLLLILAATSKVWAQPYPNSGDDIVCLNETKNYAVINNPTSTYAWTITPLVGGNGIINSGNTTNDVNVTWTNPGTAIIQVIETNASGCAGTPVTIQVTIMPNNTINLTSAVGTDNQTLCVNSLLTDITYATNGATGASFVGLPAGVTGNWAANVITISGTPTIPGNYPYTITLTGGCGTITASGNINVTPNNLVTLTSAAGTDNQTLCVNSLLTDITYGTTGATGATFAGLPAGVSGNWAGNVATISGTPSVSGTFNYTVTLTGGCGVVTTTGTINVTPDNLIALTSAAGTDAQSVCINTPIIDITYSTTGATGATFAGLPAGVNGSWAANVVTISGTPSANGTFNYTITLTGGCGTVTATGSINVTPSNTIALTSAVGSDNQTVCVNSAIGNITYATTGATGATFSGLPAGVTGSWAANVVTISGTPSVSGSYNYTIDLTGGCSVVSTTGTINVTPDNTIALSSAAGTDNQTVCNNAPITDITYTTTGATGATFAGLPAGVTGSWAANVVTISGTPTLAGTYNYTITLTGGCGTVSTTGTINVTPDNTVALSSAAGTDNQSICVNTAITDITYATTGATGATFSGLPAGVTGSWAANVVTISGTPSGTGTFNYTITLTGGCGTVTTTGTIVVTPGNTIALTSAVGTDAQSVCINTPIVDITYATTGATGATVSGLPAGVTGSWSANVFTITGTPSVSGNFTYTITLTGGCGTVTTTGTINVNALPATSVIYHN